MGNGEELMGNGISRLQPSPPIPLPIPSAYAHCLPIISTSHSSVTSSSNHHLPNHPPPCPLPSPPTIAFDVIANYLHSPSHPPQNCPSVHRSCTALCLHLRSEAEFFPVEVRYSAENVHWHFSSTCLRLSDHAAPKQLRLPQRLLPCLLPLDQLETLV